MADPKIEGLKRVPMFATLSKKRLQRLAGLMDEVDLPVDKTLIIQGQRGDTFYILLAGEVDVRVGGKPAVRLGRGTFFGEISMLDRGPATATVVTVAPCRAMVMSHVQFRDALGSDPDLHSAVLAAMANRVRQNMAGSI